MKHIIIAIIFILFAAIQLNDPDFLIWTAIYLSVGFIAILYRRGQTFPRLVLAILLTLTVYLITYLPDIYSWINDGLPNIAQEMKSSSPHIELTREFFGLLICILVLAFYYKLSIKKNIDAHA